MADRSALRALPSVDRLLGLPEAAPLLERFGRAPLTAALREELAALRAGPLPPALPQP
ncbi:hypothetical protein NON00_22055, partial [Roseomonas sp. GC11]|uniref:hypothetical protein n=1 Tax=Roseomonas sp. GC11 TaxID=2950546 RepID=UPI00210E85CB